MRKFPMTLRDFSGGLNTKLSSVSIPDNCVQACQNVIFDDGAPVAQRFGYRRFSTADISGRPVRTLFPFERSGGTRVVVAGVRNTGASTNELWEYTESGVPSATALSGGTGFSTAYEFEFAQALDRLWIVNGSDATQSYDGTTVAAAGVDGTQPAAPTVSAVAGGSVPQPVTWRYYTTNVFGSRGEGYRGTQSAQVSTTATNRTVNVTPVVGPSGTTARRVYRRDDADATNPTYFVGEVLNNTAGQVVVDDDTNTDRGRKPRTSTAIPPVALYVVWHNNRMFYLGQVGDRSRMWYSDLRTPDIVPTANTEWVGREDGGNITGAVSFQGDLVILKGRSVWVMEGYSPNEWRLRQVSGTVGCSQSRSVQVTPRGVIFMGQAGIWAWNGTQLVLLSASIEPTVNQIAQALANPARLEWSNSPDFTGSGGSIIDAYTISTTGRGADGDTGPFPQAGAANAGVTPAPAAGDPPSSLVVQSTKLLLDTKSWTVTRGNTTGSYLNESFADADATNTNTRILGATSGYVNGANGYTDVLAAEAQNGTILNAGFEDANGANWSALPQNYTGHVDTQTVSANQAAFTPVPGFTITPDAGTRMGYMEFRFNGGTNPPDEFSSFRLWFRIFDPSNNRIGDTAAVAIVDNETWTTFTVDVTGAGAVQGQPIRLQITAGDSGANMNYFGRLLSDVFVFSGTNPTIRVLHSRRDGDGTRSGSLSTRRFLAFDEIVGGRASYPSTTSFEYISPTIRPTGFSRTAGGQNEKTKWYRAIRISYDMPNVPAGVAAAQAANDAQFLVEARSGTVENQAWASMGAVEFSQTVTTRGAAGSLAAVTYNFSSAANNSLASNPYMRFRIVMNNAGVTAPSATTSTGTCTPVIKEVRVTFRNNFNYYWSQKIDLGSSASAYSPFLTSQTANGSTITYAVRTSTTVSGLDTAGWTLVMPGSTPSNTFGRYVEWYARITPVDYMASDPEIEAVSFGWLNGNETTMDPVTSAWHEKRYWLSFQTRGSAFNSRVLILDSRGAWTVFTNINALALCVFKDKLLCGIQRVAGDSANLADGRVTIQGDSLTDDGATTFAGFSTKDFVSPDARAGLAVRAVEMVGRGISSVTTLSPQIGLSGAAFFRTAINLYVTVSADERVYPAISITLPWIGSSTSVVSFPASIWGASVGMRIFSGQPNTRWQLDSVTVSMWQKEPEGR